MAIPDEHHAAASPTRGQNMVALSLVLGVLAWLGFYVAYTVTAVDMRTNGLSTPAQIGFIAMVASASCLGFAAVAFFLVGVIRWAFSDMQLGRLEALANHAREIDDQLKVVSERLMISEAAKRIASRERDRGVLRVAIEDDIKKGDFDAALVLVSEMAGNYGYATEAEDYRERIGAARAVNLAMRVAEAMAGFEALLSKYDWEKSNAEAAKIQRLFPDVSQVRDLPKRVKEAWEARKHDLERQFLQAASHDDVETAMDLLKEMDKYLTEREAAPFLETARGVIGKKRQNLGVQFKMAVQDKEWARAVAVGEQIIREFPNSKMSDEVRDRIDILRERAAGQREAERAQTAV